MRRKAEVAVGFGVPAFGRQHDGITGGCWLSQPQGGGQSGGSSGMGRQPRELTRHLTSDFAAVEGT
jgi:hypothetical protein